MADFQQTVARGGVRAQIDEGLRAHLNKVYGLMATAMVVTFAIAFFVGTNAQLLATFFTGPVRWVVMFAPLIAVMGLSFGIQRLSVGAATAVFYGFSALMGLSIAWIFAVFGMGVIAQAFLATAVAFLGLSLNGYTTQKDLTGIGRFAIMGLVGVIVLFLINIFFPFGSAFMFALNVAVLLIFAALTAYDTQRLKSEYIAYAEAGAHGHPEGRAWLAKAGIMGATSLYLNFINMFMVILQFMGGGDE